MALPPMVVFDPYTAADYQAMFEKHSWTDRSEVDIDQYLTPEERRDMGDYEKDRLRNIKKNYDVMIDMGLPAKKPYFMVKNRPRFLKPVDESSDSDGDWVPSKNKRRAKKPVTAGWKPPIRPTESSSSVKPSKVSAKVKHTKPKSRTSGAGSRKKPALCTTQTVSEEVQEKVLSDTDDGEDDFEGFSAVEIAQSEARAAEIVPRNEDILAAIEGGTYHFDDSDSEEEESGDSEAAQVTPESVTETPTDQPASAETPSDRPGRYPRRSIVRKVYTEQEVPKDDDYLYCEDCDFDYEGDCPIHGPLFIIHDTKVANDGSDPDRADHSLPLGLVVRKSQIQLAGDGVWAEHAVRKGARFGPYEGIKEEDMDEAHKSGYCWQIYENGKKVSHYIDAADKSHANWLRYVNCARNEGEQNLLAYQFHGEVYYRTVQEITPGQELLVWYGDEYGRELGLLPHGEAVEVQAAQPTQPTQPTQLNQAALQTLFHNAGFEVFTCEVCDRVFPSETWRDGHRKAHGDRTGSKRYTCTQCNYSTDISNDYNKHLVIHSGQKPHTCKVCGKGFTQLGALTTHQRTHTGVRPYSCTVCGKGFTRSSILQTHSRTHTGHKAYSCPLCARGFNQSQSLTTHMRTHTGEKPYVCTTCRRGFSHSQTLTTHMRTHTGEKPYVCTTCGRGFSDSGNLTKHMRTHTGEKPYVCTTCGLGFSDSSSLTRHMRKHTRV